MVRKVGLLLTLAVLLLAAAATPASAQTPGKGVISGRVTSGSASSAPVGNAEVNLYSMQGQAELPVRTTRTDASGRYTFTGLPVGPGYAYVAFTTFQKVEYLSARVQLSDQKPVQTADVVVYNSSPDSSAVHVKSATVVILGVDSTIQAVSVLETFILENPTKQTFLPTSEGPEGPMGLLRFSLPADATGITASGELSSRQVIQTNKGFGTDQPLRPGQTEVTFSYQIPYRGDSRKYAFDMTMPYPTQQFRLLVGPNGPKVTSPQLRQDAPAPIWGDKYLVLAADNVAPRARFEIALSNLPVNIWFLRPQNRWLWAAAAALASVLIAAALLLWRRSRRALSAAREAEHADRERLVAAIAELDGRYESGQIEESAYRDERELHKRRLIALMSPAE